MRRIFLSGWTDRPTDRLWLLTLTAPGNEAHRRRDGTVCPCTPPGGVSLAEWNAMAGHHFNRLIQDVRRRCGDVQYCRAAEVQKRGALHFHVLVRGDVEALSDADKRSGTGLPNAGNPRSVSTSVAGIRALALKHGFGHAVDLQLVRTEAAAGYCAKYVSKSAADRESMPWLDRSTGEVQVGAGRYRPWSASRRWGLTMLALKRAQAAWASEQLGSEPEATAGGDVRDPETRISVLYGNATGPPPLDPRTGNYTGPR